MDTADLVGEISKRHRVVLDSHDPVLMIATVLEVILKAEREKQLQAVREAADQMVAATAAQAEDAKGVAGRLITNSGDYVAERVREAIQGASASLVASIVAEKEVIIQQTKEIRLYTTAAFACVLACGGILLAMFLSI